jgi:hypothetical protein
MVQGWESVLCDLMAIGSFAPLITTQVTRLNLTMLSSRRPTGFRRDKLVYRVIYWWAWSQGIMSGKRAKT